MDIRDEIKTILAHTVEEVIASQLSMSLLRCYSTLYLCGGQPRTCSNSQKLYYKQLSDNGMQLAEKLLKAKNRVCKPAWKGNKYVPKNARFYNSDLITDDEAIDLLNRGFLTEKDFTVLPQVEKTETTELSENELACIGEFKGLILEGYTRDQIREKYKNVEKIGDKKATTRLIDKLFKIAKDETDQ
jgi:hypothetical protein